MGRKSHNGKYQQEDTDYLKKTKTLTQKTYMYLHVHCGAIYNSWDMGTALVPSVDKWIKNMWFIYTMEYCCCCRQVASDMPTLCDPIDGSPPGSSVPGILQARTLEWVAISFSNALKWKVKVKLLSHVRLFVTLWTAAHQAPLSMGFSRQEYWSGCHCLLLHH